MKKPAKASRLGLRAIDVECPTCGARAGIDCDFARGGRYHFERVQAAIAATRESNRAARIAASKGE